MFGEWDNFYLIIGPSAAALIGLLFVVATLTSGEDEKKAVWGASLYTTPTVFHLAVVLVLSALAAVPALGPRAVAAVVGVCALVGFVYSLRSAVALYRGETMTPPHWSDVHFYGCGPAAIHAVLLGAAAAIWMQDAIAAHLLGFTLLALLLLAIRNAWDLVTFLAMERHGAA